MKSTRKIHKRWTFVTQCKQTWKILIIIIRKIEIHQREWTSFKAFFLLSFHSFDGSLSAYFSASSKLMKNTLSTCWDRFLWDFFSSFFYTKETPSSSRNNLHALKSLLFTLFFFCRRMKRLFFVIFPWKKYSISEKKVDLMIRKL